MSNKKYFSYIRVSTQRQGQHGTSLAEQQTAIDRYAQNWNFRIVKRFEERETAAKQGRPVFLEMLKQLKKGVADGVIIHKIDRSARNLKDWADLGTLIDNGMDVHFANESVDLSSRGGRLSADIQAVVASDYIRNLREETKKGIYGRLKQGLFPFKAMIGYLDRGGGKPKEIDPETAPLIRKAFELYATGDWGLEGLVEKMNKLGLRNKSGTPVTRNGLAAILHSLFYIGVIRIAKTGETFVGQHRPIISKALFEQVQNVFEGRNFKTEKRHFFVFRRLVNCSDCGRLMSPETQKGHVYYRCHSKNCIRKCLKEELMRKEILRVLKKLVFTETEFKLLRSLAQVETRRLGNESNAARLQLEIKLNEIKGRYSRLADAVVDGLFDEETYILKKNELVDEENALRSKLADLHRNEAELADDVDQFFELANSAYLSYKSAHPEDQRNLVKTIVSNITSDGISVSIKLKTPFQIVAERKALPVGAPNPRGFRTPLLLIKQVFFSLCEKSRDHSGELALKA